MVREIHAVLFGLVVWEQPLTFSIASAVREFVVVDRRTEGCTVRSFTIDRSKGVSVTAATFLLCTVLVFDLLDPRQTHVGHQSFCVRDGGHIWVHGS